MRPTWRCFSASRMVANTRAFRRVRFQHHLGPARISIVKVLIRGRRLVQRQFMRDQERRLRASGCDQVAKISVVSLYVALPRAHGKPFLKKLADVEGDLAPL